MTSEQLIDLLQQVSDADWQAVVDGRAIVLVDDQRLETGEPSAHNILVRPPQPPVDAARLKVQTLDNAASLLDKYYFVHPLTQAGFNRQVLALVAQHGAGAFAAKAGELPEFTLFVEGGIVLAESADSPRHRYGAYFEINTAMQHQDLATALQNWVHQGQAYERYLSMNVCRYNC